MHSLRWIHESPTRRQSSQPSALGVTASDQREVLLAQTPRVRVGLLVGEVLGVRRIALDSLDRALASSDSTRGIAEARTVLLDLEALLADARFEPADDRRECGAALAV
jgi:chemotaxis signal transduction protein